MTKQSTPALIQLTIDLDAVAHNANAFAQVASPDELMVVVKADGYNHGALNIARTVLTHGARRLGVATVAEGIALRAELEAAGVRLDGQPAPITAWMWQPAMDLHEAFDAGLTIGVPSLTHAKAVLACARARVQVGQQPPTVGLMVDTGLSRSGVAPGEWEETVAGLASGEKEGILQVDGVFTHLSSADDASREAVTNLQAERFEAAIRDCRAAGLAVPNNHIANTPATLTRPDLRYQVVRPGVGIYGVDPVPGGSSALQDASVDLRPAMAMRAQIITTRTVPAGESVSYGGKWTAEVDTRTAVVAAGYADGVPRSASGKMQVSINGRRYQQVGQICMDQFVVVLGAADDPAVGDVQPGDWAVIFGGGDGEPTVDELAGAAGTIAYEILTMPRGPRVELIVLPAADSTTAEVAPGSADGWGIDLSSPGGVLKIATADDMRAAGREIGRQLTAGTVVSLTGPLGAGKTTITQGIAEGMQVKGRVQSPTFTIVRTHKPGDSGVRLLHMDAYRLLGEGVTESVAPGESLDRDDVLDTLESLDIDADLSDAVLVAEWGRGVVEALSDRVLDVEIVRDTGEATADAAPGDPAVDPDDEDDPRELHWHWRVVD